MKSLRTALVALGVIAFLIGLGMLAVILSSDGEQQRGFKAVLVLTLAWSFVGTGLFAWARRPDNQTGALMTAVGFAWFGLGLSLSDSAVLYTVGWVFDASAVVLLVHLVLAFPGGRLRTRGDRIIVALGWLAAVGLDLIAGFFYDPQQFESRKQAPDNLLLVDANQSAYDVINGFAGLLGIVLLGLVVVRLLQRRGKEPESQRAAIAPVLWAAGIAFAMYILTLVTDVAGLPDALTSFCFIVVICSFVAIPFAFLFGLLRGRFSRAGSVSELVERLGGAPVGGSELREALASAVDDPTLEIAYWLPEQRLYVNAEGMAMTMPESGSGRVSSSVSRDGQIVAAIIHDEALLEEPGMIETVGAAAALALANEQLEAELRARIEQLRASRARIVEAGDAARRRIERDLHDGAQQRLVALSLDMKLARSMVDKDPEQAAKLLDQTVEELDLATRELRELARGIHPAVLSDLGLEEALSALATRSPLPVELEMAAEQRLPAPVESAAYFVVSEALTNVARYAQASHARVRVDRSNGRVTVEISDDGVGGADPTGGTGLRGLEDRVAALDGTMSVVSPSGQGTVVCADIPCA